MGWGNDEALVQLKRDAAKAKRLEAEIEQLRRRVLDIGVERDNEHTRRVNAEKAERALRDKIRALELVRVWTNADGKRFVFADDVFAIIAGEACTHPDDKRKQMLGGFMCLACGQTIVTRPTRATS